MKPGEVLSILDAIAADIASASAQVEALRRVFSLPSDASKASREEAARARVLLAVRACAPCTRKRAVERAGGNNADAYRAIGALVEEGVLVEQKQRQGGMLTIATGRRIQWREMEAVARSRARA